MRGYTLTNVMYPADAQDVATKQYVDGANKAFVFGKGRYMAVADVSRLISRTTNNKKSNAYVSILIELDLQSKNI